MLMTRDMITFADGEAVFFNVEISEEDCFSALLKLTKLRKGKKLRSDTS